ncbi:response regulator [Pendulispora brunnea]|uniref:Response regulator n=1 Tax=Pendulispora brunnea TaxID=2905690 RepID=A0ABZ2K6R5_9BACT
MTVQTPLVLVADDEPSMLELVARHLRTMKDPSIEVIEASDGEQAWSLAQEHLPDLVVLDVMMPGMSGWEVCRKIREEVALAHTGVLMLTGIGENLNQLTSPLYGADAYIDKPFDFGELDDKVRIALEAREAQREGISRPPLNGVAGAARPARIAKAAAKKKTAPKAKKKAAKKPAPKKVTPKKVVAQKAAPKKAAPKKAAVKKAAPKKKATAPKKIAAKAAKAVKNGAAKKNGASHRKAPPKPSKAPKVVAPPKAGAGAKASGKKAPARGKARATR